MVHPRRPVARHGDLPVPVGFRLLGHRARRGRRAGAVAAAPRPRGGNPRPPALRARVRLSRNGRKRRLHSRRDGVAALLQPAGGAGRPVAPGAGALVGGHGTGRAALQPPPAAQLGPPRLPAAHQPRAERRRAGGLLRPLGAALPGARQRPPSGDSVRRPRRKDAGPCPTGTSTSSRGCAGAWRR